MTFSSRERKEERLNRFYDPSLVVEDRTYNMAMGGTVLYGLIVNAVICNVAGDIYTYVNPIVFLIGYFALCIAGMAITYGSQSPVVSFIGYNLVVLPVGLVVSSAVYYAGGLGSEVVSQAFLYTILITAVMVALSISFPNFFSKLGGVLFTALIGLLISGFIIMIVGASTLLHAYIGAAIFSLYIGFDFWRSQQYEKTINNAIHCSLDIYMDVVNLFLRLIRILGRANRR